MAKPKALRVTIRANNMTFDIYVMQDINVCVAVVDLQASIAKQTSATRVCFRKRVLRK